MEYDAQKALLVLAMQDKMVIKIKGDDDFANSIVTAAQSFPETAMVSRRAQYRIVAD